MTDKPYLKLHGLVFILATTAVLGHLISLPAATLVTWRTGIAAIVFFLILRPKSAPNAPPYRLQACLTGIILGAHWMTFFGAIKLSNITVCLTGMATTSLFTALTEAIQERRPPRASELILGLITIPAIILIVGVAEQATLGLLIAMLSALLAATFTVINKTLVRRGVPSSGITQYEMLGASLTCLLTCMAINTPIGDYLPASSDWLWLLILALVCTVYAYELHVRLLRHFSAFESNLAINFEPVYGILMAALLFHEHQQLHPMFFVGSLTIIFANFIRPLMRLLKKKAT